MDFIFATPKSPPLTGFIKGGDQITFYIKENSWLAKIAASKMNARSIAMVLGKTIHLYNCSQADFIGNKKWLQHELCHVRQFKEHGNLFFVVLYLIESLRNGYDQNKYEIAARAAEEDQLC